MGRDIHIITLNVPFPADYGGIIDSFHRIRMLQKLGADIHLHAFQYGRSESRELESLCKSVKYYSRDESLKTHFSLFPYIVRSRNSAQILKDLAMDDYPVLFDGLHTTYYIGHPSLKDRKKIVRVHNIEHHYYLNLSRFEKHPLRKIYYFLESIKLKRYETILEKADWLLSVSENEHRYFIERYGTSIIVPVFHPFDKVESQPGSGDNLVYHGDLSVNENIIIADYLISEVFSKIPYKCIIAGKDPPQHLQRKAMKYDNIILIPDPDESTMTRLIKDAHINILPVKKAGGLKLKLLYALFAGRHCLVNSETIKGTSLESACNIADSAKSMIALIHNLMMEPFTRTTINEREKVLLNYNNTTNAFKLTDLFFSNQI